MMNFLHIASITLPLLLKGLIVTIEISVLGILISLVAGFFINLMCLSKNKIIELIRRIYIKIFRCTPFMVQVYLAYYGLPALGIHISAFYVGVLILGAYYAAYNAVIFESGIRALPKGQEEAAVAIGMNKFQCMTRILLPQTVSVIMPSLTGMFMQTVKDSSILSVITVAEMTMETKEAIGITFSSLFVYILAGLLYWILNIAIENITGKIERQSRVVKN